MNSRQRLFSVEIDAIRMPRAVGRLMECVDAADDVCRYVVTPNVDHALLLRDSAPLRRAYEQADLVLADGMPIVWASRLLGRPLPQRVTGADLVPALLDAADSNRPLRVYLLGAGPGVAERAAAAIEKRWPAVRVVGTYSPPMGFENDEAENAKILRQIDAAAPDVLVVGLGAPKQELWVHAHRHGLRAKVALCVGATIDFLAGEKPRAPAWMRATGLEWLFRVASEPKRLLTRYARGAWVFPQLVWREWRTGSNAHPTSLGRCAKGQAEVGSANHQESPLPVS